MSSKQWKAEKRFVLDCPICREPALPQQVSNQYGKSGFSLIHPGRIAPCFVREGTDAFEHVRTDFNGAFGRDVTTDANQTPTGRIRIRNDSEYPEWSATYIGNVDSNKYEKIKNFLFGQDFGIDVWEDEGGACYLASNPD